MSRNKSAEHKSNGGSQSSERALKVTNQQYGDLYKAFETLPGSTIRKNLGTVLKENFVNRAWLSEQIGIFHRNERKLKPHFDELYAKQTAYLKSRDQFIKDTLENASDVEKLKDITGQVKKNEEDWRNLMEKEVELPELEKIPNSLIKDFEILNQFIAAFWKYGVDFDK